MNPTASDFERMCCKHHIAHNKASVVNAVRPIFIRKHDEHGGRSVKRIEALLPTAGFTVHLRQSVTEFFIRYGNDNRHLLSLSARGAQSRIDDAVDDFFRYSIAFKTFCTPPRFYSIDDFVHVFLPDH